METTVLTWVVLACVIVNLTLSLSGNFFIKSNRVRYAIIIALDAALIAMNAYAGSILGVVVWLVLLCIDAVKTEDLT